MTGTLGLFSLLDLIQLLSSSLRTGCLNIEHPSNEARVYFSEGKIVHAEFGYLRGEEAIVELFKDEEGAFEFEVGTQAPQVSIDKTTENLLLLAIRVSDESSKSVLTTQVSETAVPIFATDAPDAGSLTLYAQEISILRLIDSRSTVEQIAQRANMDVSEVKQVIARLMRIGALSLRDKKPRIARLVTQLTKAHLDTNVVGVDRKIINNWQKVLNFFPTHIACKQANGKVIIFQVKAVDGSGPYILMSQDTFFKNSLAANVTLLVRPIDN